MSVFDWNTHAPSIFIPAKTLNSQGRMVHTKSDANYLSAPIRAIKRVRGRGKNNKKAD